MKTTTILFCRRNLAEKINSGESVTAYFFSPECAYCKQMTPVLMPIAKEMNVDVYQYNLLEFHENAVPYGIEGTPTLIHFKDGKEIDRLYGGPLKAADQKLYSCIFSINMETK